MTGLFSEDVLIRENEQFGVYRDSWCARFEQSLREYSSHGYSMPVEHVYLIREKRDGNEYYVAVDVHQNVIISFRNYTDLDFMRYAWELEQAENDDLINMAIKKKEMEAWL